ncbi:MAG TPA: phosphoethanolamine transferase [Psychromonas hadalis]|nr:phosphoethanolamine transferase [Psychromonas hadalis]
MNQATKQPSNQRNKPLSFLLEYFICLGVSFLVVRSLGLSGLLISYLSISLFLASSSKYFKKILVYPLLIVSFFYMPVGLIYGKPNVGILYSLLETNVTESLEFISNFPIKVYFYFVVLIFVYGLYVTKRFRATPFRKVKLLVALLLLFYPKTSAVYQFGRASYSSFNMYVTSQAEFSAVLNENISIQILKRVPKYKIYVVVIGESMRKDYMSLYGYPLKTTPFLDSVNGFFLDGYISTAPNTATSLPRTLVASSGINIINLAKAANFETYWISNQGYMGVYDTAISKVAVQSDHINFLKHGEYNSSHHYDEELIPYFKRALLESNIKNKVIVLHLMGSHPSFDRRVKKDHYHLKRKELSFYLSTYNETDQLLKNIYQDLQSTGKSFSLMYFSDHGLSNKNDRQDDVYLAHRADSKANYEIPFLRLSSDDTVRTFKKAKVSAFHFLSFYSDWLGIQTNEITPIKIDSFVTEKVRVFNWSKMVDFNSLKDDPVILPLEKD